MATSSRLEETPLLDNKTDSLEPLANNSQTQADSLPSLLPRTAWNSQVTFLRTIFRVKKALDRIEQEAGVIISSVNPNL